VKALGHYGNEKLSSESNASGNEFLNVHHARNACMLAL